MASMTQVKELRHAYGFDDIAIVPGDVTINPELASLEFTLRDITFRIPVLASAMDAVSSPSFAGAMHKAGGLAVVNLEGLYTRYDDADAVVREIASATPEQSTAIMQKAYSAPMKEELVGKRVREIKATGAVAAVSITPQNTKRLAALAVEAGADIIVVQSTVTTARHQSRSYHGLVFSELLEDIRVPVIVGNVATYSAALELMETGVDALLVGVGPGAACTTREVVGIGVPQVSATLDCAAARDEYKRRTGKYVSLVTDGGMRIGGDICKAIVCGADAVMLGTPMAQAAEAPGKGFNWGMATPHAALPRGTRIKTGTKGTLQEILFGPARVTDGSQNLMGALQVAMGMLGAFTIRDMHQAEVVYAPAIKTEGKGFQMAQGLR